jgi:preprotein translocase subunit SecY
MIGILARFPNAVRQEFLAKIRFGQWWNPSVCNEIAILVAVIMGLIVLIQGVRKVPVNYAKQIVGNRQFGGARQFLPLKVNSAGVMPIIFAQAIMFLPTLISYTSFENRKGSQKYSQTRAIISI